MPNNGIGAFFTMIKRESKQRENIFAPFLQGYKIYFLCSIISTDAKQRHRFFYIGNQSCGFVRKLRRSRK